MKRRYCGYALIAAAAFFMRPFNDRNGCGLVSKLFAVVYQKSPSGMCFWVTPGKDVIGVGIALNLEIVCFHWNGLAGYWTWESGYQKHT